METNLQQHLVVAAGVAIDRSRILLMRRRPGVDRSGEWEFPGGKVQSSESLVTALRREIKEELNIDCKVGSPLAAGSFSNGVVVGYRIELLSPPLSSVDHDEIRWVPSHEVLDLKLSLPDYQIAVAALQQPLEIERLSTDSLVRFTMTIYFVFGLVFSAGLMILNAFFAPFFPGVLSHQFPLSWGTLFFVPLLYAVLGVVTGFVIANAYNLISTLVGGISLRTRRK